jgi:hypothetical protein
LVLRPCIAPISFLDQAKAGPRLTGGPRGTEAGLVVFVILAGLFYFFSRAYPAAGNSLSPVSDHGDGRDEHSNSKDIAPK